MKSSRLGLIVGMLALLFLSPVLEAATKTWTGGGVNANWSTAANWSPSGGPVAGDDLVFPAGALQLTNNNDTAAGTSYNTLSITGAASGYTLNGNGIQLAAGLSADNGGVNSIALGITLGASQTFSFAGQRTIFEGAIALGASTLTLSPSSTGLAEIRAGISGTGGVTVTGSGIISVSTTACTYSGPTNVSGYLSVSATGLNVASAVTVTGSGAQLQMTNSASVGPLTMNSGSLLELFGGGTDQIGSVTNLTMQAGSTFDLGFYSATNYSQLNVSGTATLNNPTLTMGFAYTPAPGTSFTILNKASGGAVAGTFSGRPEGSLLTVGGRTLRITYLGGDGNDVVLTDLTPTPSAVPAVGTLGLAVLGALLALSAVFALRRSA